MIKSAQERSLRYSVPLNSFKPEERRGKGGELDVYHPSMSSTGKIGTNHTKLRYFDHREIELGQNTAYSEDSFGIEYDRYS